MDGNYASWLSAEDGDDKFFEFRWIGKFRGHFEPTVYHLRRATCPRLVDADGNPAHSVWAEVADDHQLDQAAYGQTEDEDAVLMAVADYPGKSLSDWAKLLDWKTGSGAPAKNWVDRALKRMAKREELVRLGRGRQWHLLEAGKKEAKRVAERTRNGAV